MSNRKKAAIATVLIMAIALRLSWLAQASLAQVSPKQAQSVQPERVLVGAYDAAHVNGLVFISGQQNAVEQNLFGLRFLAFQKSNPAYPEESPRSFELGAHAPDGSYARVDWQPQFDPTLTITLRWSRIGKQAVAGQLSASANVRMAVEAYSPWSDQVGGTDYGHERSSWVSYAAQMDRQTIFGEQIHTRKNKPLLRHFLLRTDRAGLGAGNYNNEGALRSLLALLPENETRTEALPGTQPAALRSTLAFDLAANAPLGFVAEVGDDFDAMQDDIQTLMQKPVVQLLNKAEADYEANRTLSGGALGESFDAINRATMWNRLYSPTQRYEYVTMHRLSRRGLRGDALSWDGVLAAAMTGISDGAAATSAMRVLLAGQTPDGRVPLRRYLQNAPNTEPPVLAGRSMPPIGAFCALKIYLMTQDLEFLAWVYPRLQQWNDWWRANRGDGEQWRDGNKDGLLEWGFDAELESGAFGLRALTDAGNQQMALSESGYADRPPTLFPDKPKTEAAADATAGLPARLNNAGFNDQTHTLEFSSVALNSLYALDTELMVMISREIGLTTEADRWQARYDELKRLMNEKLWSEADGVYLDRHWDGRFARRVTLDSFYPLLAGIPDEAKAKRMLAVLHDPKKFWGDHLLPSIARNDPLFAGNASGQTLAGGAIHAATNYLLYAGLKRYGFYQEASELARKSTALARSCFEKPADKASTKGGRLFDLFSSLTGQPIDGELSSQHASFGSQSFSGQSFAGQSFTGMMFLPGLEEVISADPWLGLTIGSLVVADEARIERMKIAGASFDVVVGPKRTVVRRGDNIEIEFEAPVRLRNYRSGDRTLTFVAEAKEEVRALVPAVAGRKVTVSVNDKVLGSTSPGSSATFKVKAGQSRVLIVK